MTQTNGIGSQPWMSSLIDRPEQTAQAKGGSAEGSSPARQSDAASLSGAGSLLAASADSEVRSAKVESLKAAIASGAYTVSAGSVADKLMQHMLE